MPSVFIKYIESYGLNTKLLPVTFVYDWWTNRDLTNDIAQKRGHPEELEDLYKKVIVAFKVLFADFIVMTILLQLIFCVLLTSYRPLIWILLYEVVFLFIGVSGQLRWFEEHSPALQLINLVVGGIVIAQLNGILPGYLGVWLVSAICLGVPSFGGNSLEGALTAFKLIEKGEKVVEKGAKVLNFLGINKKTQ